MNTWKLSISGADLAKRLRSLPDALTKRVLTEALKAAGEPMRRRMSELAPRGPDAPHLADHIGINFANRVGDVGGGRWTPSDVTEFAVAIGPTQDYFYGLFWEFGWVHHPSAHPFARPAFDSTVTLSLQIIGRLLWAALRAAAPETFQGAGAVSGAGTL